MPVRSPLQNAVRSSARIALWASLAGTLAAGWFLGEILHPVPAAGFAHAEAAQELWMGVDFEARPEVRLLQQYVAVDTSQPDPDEVAGAEFLAAQLAAAGIPSTIERLGERNANLWAFVEGDDPRAVVLLGHIDVEPPLATEGWLYPPFEGRVRGPWIYGRGMFDMKSLAVAQLLATIDVARSGRRPRRSLLFLQTSNEEAGSDTGMRWLLAERPELVARMDTVLAEGGVVEAISPTEVKYWGIEFAQKTFARVSVCAPDRESLQRLAAYIRRHAFDDPRPDVDPAVERFLAAYAPTRGLGSFSRLLARPATLPLRAPAFDRLSRFMKALFRNEVAAGRPVADPEGGWRLDLVLHLLPGEDPDAAFDRLVPPWLLAGLDRTPVALAGSGPASEIDHPDFRAIVRRTGEAHPGVPVGPFFLLQAMTDARLLRGAGVRTYGYSPFPSSVTDTLQAGLANERMQLPAYLSGVELYRSVVRELVE